MNIPPLGGQVPPYSLSERLGKYHACYFMNILLCHEYSPIFPGIGNIVSYIQLILKFRKENASIQDPYTKDIGSRDVRQIRFSRQLLL